MTILSQAQTIRDETVRGANTALRVGTCLVDVANDLSVLQAQAASLLNKSRGNMFMVANTTPTVCTNTTDFFKVSGTTTDNDTLNNDFDTGATPILNHLRYTGTETKVFKLECSLTFYCDHGSHVVEAGFYCSNLSGGSGVDLDTVGRVMGQAGAQKETQLCFQMLLEMSTNDYVSVYFRGVESAESYVISQVNVIITEA